jgi:hypothetical protein
MALGYTTYKTPNAIYTIREDLTGSEGRGVVLWDNTGGGSVQGGVRLAVDTVTPPYGIVSVGGPSAEGTYPGLIGGSSVEFVDQLGCVVQAAISPNAAVAAGEFLLIDSAEGNGTFTGSNSQAPAVNDWLWGYALTDAQPGEQCVMRFQPVFWFSTYTPPAP